MRDTNKIENLKIEANKAKDQLISIMYSLEEAGGIKEANSLEKIIIGMN